MEALRGYPHVEHTIKPIDQIFLDKKHQESKDKRKMNLSS